MRGAVLRGSGAVVLLAVSAGCAPAAEPEPPATVECDLLYRPQAGSDADEEEHRLEVPSTGPGSAPERVELGPMTFTAAYTAASPDGAGVVLAVADETGAVLVRNLYQSGAGEVLATEFPGGHGFTGLQYTYHGDAELQHFCRAGE